jgi:hypothetical protein
MARGETQGVSPNFEIGSDKQRANKLLIENSPKEGSKSRFPPPLCLTTGNYTKAQTLCQGDHIDMCHFSFDLPMCVNAAQGQGQSNLWCGGLHLSCMTLMLLQEWWIQQ